MVPVLQAFAREDNLCTISYRGLMRYAGIGSHSTVATALKRFQALHIVHVHKGRTSDGLRACNVYQLTLDDPFFLRLAHATSPERIGKMEFIF